VFFNSRLEIKTGGHIIDAHRAQALHYLKATGLRLAIILNFGKEKLEYKRMVK
jgi:GxxExxY protein